MALSPGINDLYTALTSLDWLGSFLVHALELPPPDPFRYDESGTLRLVIPVLARNELLDHILDRLRHHIISEPTVALRTMDLLADLAEHVTTPSARTCIEAHSGLLVSEARRKSGKKGSGIERMRSIDTKIRG